MRYHARSRARGRQIAWLIMIAACLVGIPVLLALRPSAAGHLLAALPVLAMAFLGLAWWESQRALATDRDQVAAEAEELVLRQRTFLQDAAHQLQSPITIALGHAELLAAALAGSQWRDIDVIVGELERLKSLSERLLLVASSENADFLELAPVELGLVAADLLVRWRPVANRRWRLAAHEPSVACADRSRLELALDALVENAVQHTGPGDEITIAVRGTDSDGFTRIVITDTGEGIAEDDIPRIFDRFTSIGGANRGTGLGLAMVRAIAHGHGGRVAVRSAVGLGSTFEVLIPAAREPGSPITGADPVQDQPEWRGETGSEARRREARCE
ncbi:MAG: HAMP domain-containing sensor histidine kinase [Actinomycetota bacterium]|nr:HAMP domain-containing sensor histidine kinase [Actinomycetota bacterium]